MLLLGREGRESRYGPLSAETDQQRLLELIDRNKRVTVHDEFAIKTMIVEQLPSIASLLTLAGWACTRNN